MSYRTIKIVLIVAMALANIAAAFWVYEKLLKGDHAGLVSSIGVWICCDLIFIITIRGIRNED